MSSVWTKGSWVVSMLAVIGSSGCAAEVGTGAAEDGALSDVNAALGTDSVVKEWDSDQYDNLSSWKDLSCYTDYGPSYMVTGLKAYSQKGSLDSYVARLEGECSEYEVQSGFLVQNGVHQDVTLFTSDHKDDGEWTKVDADEYAVGVGFETDPWSDYVQTFYLETAWQPVAGGKCKKEVPGLTAYVGPYNPGFSEPVSHSLECPDQYVATNVAVKYDTKKGKIRQVKLTCRAFAD